MTYPRTANLVQLVVNRKIASVTKSTLNSEVIRFLLGQLSGFTDFRVAVYAFNHS
jgi:hypothetical protein